MNIAYLCNSFPEPSESYVSEEIAELRRHSAKVFPCSVRRPRVLRGNDAGLASETLYLFPVRVFTCISAVWLCVRRYSTIRDLVRRAIGGPEPTRRRLRTVAHTLAGAYFAARIRRLRPDHIHVHHGYFASWISMVAARLLDIGFSMTLHGSDLLVRADYLDVKLRNCRFCFTISEFNRDYVLDHYPCMDKHKVIVQRLGVGPSAWLPRPAQQRKDEFKILSVGRLHPVKNHAFLILACRTLQSAGVRLKCTIAGDGEERPRLEQLIHQLELQNQVRLAGHIQREELRELYADADVVVLNSHSEGIPLTLMEAMATERIVIAPDISGIPELVCHGQTGFLYRSGSMEDFVVQLQIVLHTGHLLNKMRRAARQQVLRSFNSKVNLERFVKAFLTQLQGNVELHAPEVSQPTHEDPVLQQV
jgi:colanic acid/amylovoran biosynthesis glycosyltransferase